MAIKGKFIADDAINGEKFKLNNAQALRARNAANTADVELISLDSSDRLQMVQMPYLPTSPTEASHAATKAYVDAKSWPIGQTIHVAKNGVDSTADGSPQKPFLTISGALAAIVDATPTKRYAIKIAAGAYTEASLALKANVFLVGEQRDAVRVTLSSGSVTMAADFTGSGDNRSGAMNVIFVSACNFNWSTVTSAAGKLYFSSCSFSSTVTLYGHNNAIAQAQFDSCQFYGVFTVSGINVGVHVNNIHFAQINLNQHPNGGMATILAASGGSCGTIVLTTTVTDFNRRCSLFARSFYIDTLTVDGASSYADITESSVPRYAANLTAPNNGNVVYLNSNIPYKTNDRNFGDLAKQYLYNFAYVHASTDTDLYLISMGSAYAAAGTGRSIFIESDSYGLNANVNGGDINITTATTSGTGVRGKVSITGREVDVNSAKVINVANGTNANDAVNKSQLDLKADSSLIGANSGIAPLNSSGKIDSSYLPNIAITDTFVVASEAAMLALTAEVGDVAVRTDISKSFILAVSPATTLANWQELLAPADTVASVNGQTGTVVLDTDDVSEGTTNKYFSASAAKSAAVVNSTAGTETDQAASVAAMKSYVGSAVAGLVQQGYARFELNATDITNGYIDLPNTVVGTPMVFALDGRPLGPTDDFTVAGARITWSVASVGPGGEEAFVAGDIVHVYYQY